ncbi:MAG: helix-turn-helix domain-containing protein [Clostridiales bacterium]|nr:helix-turn-helix domain-containing protein [Clostridiales bacterium]
MRKRRNIYDVEKLPAVMDVRMVASLFRCSEATVKRRAIDGTIKGYKIGKLWRFNREEILKEANL